MDIIILKKKDLTNEIITEKPKRLLKFWDFVYQKAKRKLMWGYTKQQGL